jgi:heptosyltransferase-2
MKTVNLCGKLNLLQSAALMQNAEMNFVNDSAPLHIASAMNAPVTAIYCSTVPEFGFGPLSDHFKILQVEKLSCKPCGLHGYKSCPKGHFKCGEIDLSSVVCKH